MLTPPTTPTDKPLPWNDRPGQVHRDHVAGLQLDEAATDRFDRLLHDIYPEACHVDADRIATLGRWLQDMPAAEARTVLRERLDRIEQLRAMLVDPDWDRREDPCLRVRKLLDYVDSDADLIPDSIPLLGLLDDVILLELSWPAVATEAEDYRDFCAFRASENPPGDGTQRREAWISARMEALAAFQHHPTISEGHYVQSGQPDEPFHIG